MKELLLMYMCDLSELYYSAGWISNLEYTLWEVLEGNPKAFAAGSMTEEEVQKLRSLHEGCDGWFYWNKELAEIPLADGETFIRTEDWKVKFAEWKNRKAVPT